MNDESIRQLLVECGINDVVDSGRGFEGNFPSTNMFFSFRELDGETVRAEDFQCEWRVNAEMTFVYVVPEMERCRQQLHCFLEKFVEVFDCNWVLSFQYESIYAYGGSSKITWVREL
ncbi:hypothetical protein AAB988_17185 [Burkholderia contaminans]|uniref:hypothetical protein n=1 Tax=Burkholderia contaminans TaxID=488447 RepID=UPI00311866D0